MKNKKLLKVLSTSFVLGTILVTNPTGAEKVGGELPLSENLADKQDSASNVISESNDTNVISDESEVTKEKEKVELVNDDNSEKESEKLELSSDTEKEAVKAENEMKSTRGLEELKKLDYKKFSKERQQFLEKLASAIDNVPYIVDPNKDPEIYKKENPDSLTCSEFMSWGLYQSGHTEVGNHYVRHFYGDTENFTHLSYKDTLMPGDFILDYTAGRKAGHILVYAGKDANGVEYLMHSQRYKGFNPNEKTLQNGPNIEKRSEYKVANGMPIYVRYNKFSDVEDKKDSSGVNYADETNKNEIGKFQINNIKITQAEDQNKESYFESAYRFNISFSSKEKIKEGETLTLDGYYPKLHNNDKNEDYFYATFPYTSKFYDEKAKIDIKIKNGNNEVVIGQMVGNKITFNKNAENFDKVDFTISLGVPSSNRLNVEPEGRQELYEVPFYLTINGQRLSKPYKQKVKPSNRDFLTKEDTNINVNYGRIRLYNKPEEGKDIVLQDISPNPYKVFYDLAMNNNWKDAKVRVKAILPEGLEFKDNQTYKNDGIVYYTDKKTTVLADNKNINRHYDWKKGVASIDSKVVDKKTSTIDFHVTEKPLIDKKGSRYDWSYSGLDVKITDRSLLDLENKKLKSPIKFEYYVNDKLVDTVNLSNIEFMFAVSNASGGAVVGTSKEEKKVETIAFEKETRENPKLEKGQTKIVQKGVNGEKEITYKVYFENGKEVKREKVSEKVTKEPVKEITEVGTKKVIPAKPIEDIAKKTIPATKIEDIAKKTIPATKIEDIAKKTIPATKIEDIAKKTIPATKIEDIAKKTIPATKIEDIAKKTIPATKIEDIAKKTIPATKIEDIAKKSNKANKDNEKETVHESKRTSHLPKAGTSSEILTLAIGALAMVEGINLSKKRRK